MIDCRGKWRVTWNPKSWDNKEPMDIDVLDVSSLGFTMRAWGGMPYTFIHQDYVEAEYLGETK